jgi:hypothetical protein
MEQDLITSEMRIDHQKRDIDIKHKVVNYKFVFSLSPGPNPICEKQGDGTNTCRLSIFYGL